MKKGICLVVGLFLCLFMVNGCDNNNNKAHAQNTVTNPTRIPKPPAAYSAEGEFVGFIIGNGDRTHHIIVYNDEINYKFVFGNGDGVLGYYWGASPPWGTTYCPDSSCSELYVYQNRLQDVILGKSDYGLSWPFNSEYITTEGFNTISPSALKYQKVWEVQYEEVIEQRVYCNSFPPPDCLLCNGGIDDLGNPLVLSGNDCLGYMKTQLPKRDENGAMVYAYTCKSNTKEQQEYLDSEVGKYVYHKVIPFDISTLPFKHPIPVPIDIRVYY